MQSARTNDPSAGGCSTPDTAPIIVTVPTDIADLVAPYLERRRQDNERIRSDAANGRWSAIAATAHRIKGNAASFGFTQLSDIGARLERAAGAEDAAMIATLVDEMSRYLARVQLQPES